MSVRPVSEIMAEMLSRYRKRPSLQDKWRFLAGLDERGYSDFFVYGPSFGIWQIKGELKNPYELVGAGAKVAPRRIDEDIREALGKGEGKIHAPADRGALKGPQWTRQGRSQVQFRGSHTPDPEWRRRIIF